MSRFDPDLPFGESRWRTGQKTFPPMCPPHRHPLQQRRVGHGHDAPVLGTKPQGHHNPAPWAAADGQRHPDSDVGYRNGHGALHLRPRSRAWLPSPSTRNRIQRRLGQRPSAAEGVASRTVRVFVSRKVSVPRQAESTRSPQESRAYRLLPPCWRQFPAARCHHQGDGALPYEPY